MNILFVCSYVFVLNKILIYNAQVVHENSYMEDTRPSPRSSEVLEDQISDASSDCMDTEVGDIVLGTESESDASDSEASRRDSAPPLNLIDNYNKN